MGLHENGFTRACINVYLKLIQEKKHENNVTEVVAPLLLLEQHLKLFWKRCRTHKFK